MSICSNIKSGVPLLSRHASMKRRSFLKASSMALAGTAGVPPIRAGYRSVEYAAPTLSLNAYSFNEVLLSGQMSLNRLFRFASGTGFSAVDLTAYYIPGYPEVPGDQLLYEIKRNAFRAGVSFSGTGVRNDFTVAGGEALAREIDHVKQWIVAASKLGAPNIRIFDGKAPSTVNLSGAIHQQVVDAFRECARFGARYGVNVAYQNHNDFLISSREIIDIMERVDSEWFGLMLDTGSVPGPDPYQEIEQLIPFAVTWQVKELVRTETGFEPLDIKRLIGILKKYDYRGFLPLETLGEGDPELKVEAFYRNVAGSL
jgi:sugar phosphate isomerase/epimerase